MKKFDRYLFKNLFVASVFITIVLTAVVFLTQSLRLIELIMESGASSSSFWFLTLLALPRFFEVIVPLAVMAGIVFIFNKMILDSEMVAIRAGGVSPLLIARPALFLASLACLVLYCITMVVAPTALSNLKKNQQILKTQFSTMLFREGVFNQIGKGFTVYIRDRSSDGELHGLMIHDSRAEVVNHSTILAKRGVIVSDGDSNQVLVFDGSRQELDRQKNVLQTLNFQRYTIELPSSDPVSARWSEPNERTIFELFDLDESNERDIKNAREFFVEIHRRFTAPLLPIIFAVVTSCCLLLGATDRRGQGLRITSSILACVTIQGAYLAAYNIARDNNIGLVLMYLLIVLPGVAGFVTLSTFGESFRRKLLFRARLAK